MSGANERRSTAFKGIAVITGANSGLGFETARQLASMSAEATIVLACRDPQKASQAQRAITESTGNMHVKAMRLDLSSMTSVREFVTDLTDFSDEPIDSLVCNGGIAGASGATVDGFDPVFETNHLGHFLLTLSLLPHLSPTGRVISVSSDMHQPPGPRLSWPGARALAYPRRGRAGGRRRYSYSKLCNLYFTYELSRKLRAEHSGVSAAAFNPGLMTDTNFATMPRVAGAILKKVFASRVGNLDTSSAALARLTAGLTRTPIDGHYFDRTESTPTRSSELSYNVDNARDLWQFSAGLVGY